MQMASVDSITIYTLITFSPHSRTLKASNVNNNNHPRE